MTGADQPGEHGHTAGQTSPPEQWSPAEPDERRAGDYRTLARTAELWQVAQPQAEAFNALAQRIVEGSEAIACAVFLREGNTPNPKVAGTFGLPAAYAADVELSWRLDAGGEMQATLERGDIRILRDAREQILAQPRLAPIHPYWRSAGWDTLTFVPMTYQGRVLGVLCCYHGRGSEPDAEELSLLTAIADQAAVAVENSSLFRDSERRVRQLEAIARIAANFTFQQSLESMMEQVAQQIVAASAAAVASLVALAQPGAATVSRVAGSRGLPAAFPEIIERAWRASPPSLISASLRSQQAQVIHNARANAFREPEYQEAKEALEGALWQTMAVVPMVFRGESVGLLAVGYPEYSDPGDGEIAFLEAVADQAAVAVANARLFDAAQSVAVVQERQRLSRELHDSVSQALYGISLGAQTAAEQLETDPAGAKESVAYIMGLSQAGLAEMRALIFELRPEALASEGLVAALRKQAASLRARHEVSVQTDFCDEPNVPIAAKEALYRIAQEALNNIAKHAAANEVRLTLAATPGELTLSVSDDGRGFDVAQDFPGHLGLKSMRERATQAGGTMRVQTRPQGGTLITVVVPAG